MSYESYKWKGGDLITVNQMNRIEQGVLEMNEAYVPTVWQTGDTVTAEKLNKIEQGIAEGGGGGDYPIITVTGDQSNPTFTCDWSPDKIVEVVAQYQFFAGIMVSDSFSTGGTWVIEDENLLFGTLILPYYLVYNEDGTITRQGEDGGDDGGDELSPSI